MATHVLFLSPWLCKRLLWKTPAVRMRGVRDGSVSISRVWARMDAWLPSPTSGPGSYHSALSLPLVLPSGLAGHLSHAGHTGGLAKAPSALPISSRKFKESLMCMLLFVFLFDLFKPQSIQSGCKETDFRSLLPGVVGNQLEKQKKKSKMTTSQALDRSFEQEEPTFRKRSLPMR